MAGRFVLPVQQVFDVNGHPGAGHTLTFYESGTSTPLDTYTDDDLAIPNTNPVVADSAGRFGNIFLKDQDYKVVWKTKAGVTVSTADPVRAAEPTSTAVINVTTTYVVTSEDNGKLIEADATAGAFTITLPPAAEAGDGFTIHVKKTDSSDNAVTVDADGSETIDGDTDVTLPNQNDLWGGRSNATRWLTIVQPLTAQSIPLPLGYINGLTASINGTDAEHDIDLAPGVARGENDEVNIVLASALTKRLDAAWAVGSGNGGLDTGVVANTTVYYIWLIRRSGSGAVDALFSLSSTAPTMPSNYDQRRLLGNLVTDDSANIHKLFVREDEAPGRTSATATTSGTAHVFIGIPSWVKKITVMFAGVSLTGNDDILVRLGDSDGLETSGYVSSSGHFTPTAQDISTSAAGLVVRGEVAAGAYSGNMAISLQDAATNTWVASHSMTRTTASVAMGGGHKSLSAALDRVSVTRSGTDTFDAGSVSILYE